jgi:hypothetical protein
VNSTNVCVQFRGGLAAGFPDSVVAVNVDASVGSGQGVALALENGEAS